VRDTVIGLLNFVVYTRERKANVKEEEEEEEKGGTKRNGSEKERTLLCVFSPSEKVTKVRKV
jgi:hypothetical protein